MANNSDNQELDSKLLAWSAARAARWPHLFSSLIDRYLELNNLSEESLCARLHCDLDSLNHLRLCGRPDPEMSAFALDVQRVADKLGLNAGTLASIVREVDAAKAFSRAGRNRSVGSWPAANSGSRQVVSPFSSTPGMLKAARDRYEESGAKDQGSDVEVETGDAGETGGELEVQESERQEGDDKGT